ncbi:MAG: DUF501 domain-containing protein [Actinomycetota bacterium]|nr:DUF501 domain-containing protein [Actinomycetota bacterium]
MELSHSVDDEVIVEAQLGRAPRGRWAVARRCHLGVPMVIESHPRLDDGSPFPTLFWLTCPVLNRRLSRLESEGEMSRLTERLGTDADLKQRLSQAIDRYRAARDEYEEIAEAGGPPGGGPDRVKCLHAHVAHQLASPPNPVGAGALARAEWPDCREPCFEVRR